jgi:integrase
VFATKNGRRLNESNVRTRLLADATEGANERLQKDGFAPIPRRLTPHSLRRTFASLLYALGRTPPEVMEQLGPTDSKLALKVYAQAMGRTDKEREVLRALVGSPLGVIGQ